MMVDPNVSCSATVPPGFRFHPTDEELVGYYLRKKVASHKIDFNVIRDIDLYRIEPWDLQDKCGIGYEEQKEWYFFSRKYKKYPTGTKTNRATMAGFWKATGRDKAVYDKSELIIGMRKTLVFYKGRAPNGQKTNWIMREYALQTHNIHNSQEEEWVLCKAFKKGRSGQNSAADMNGDHLSSVQFHQDDQFAAVPWLQSPAAAGHLPPLQSAAISPSMLPPENNTLHNSNSIEEDDDHEISISDNSTVSHWRALDKFAASQLNHDDLSFEYRNISEVALLAAIADQ